MQFDVGYDHRTQSYYKIPKRVYASSTADRSEYRFHRHQYREIIEFLARRGIFEEQFDTKVHTPCVGHPVSTFKMPDWFTPRDYQVGIINYFVEPGYTKVTTLQTGKGKTAIALAAATQIATRTMLCVPAKYIFKWTGDALDTLGVPKDRLMVIKGSKALRTAIELGIAGKIDCDFIIVSATTLYNYFKAYENNELEEQGYLCPPHLLYQVLNIGLRLIDEVHENLHLNFKQDLYGHVNKSIMLSATLESDDPFVNKMIEIAYPFSTRYKGIEYDRYIAVAALTYRANDIHKLPHKRRKMYSQVKYEESLLKWKKVIEAYAEMIYQIVVNEYVEEREEGQRMIIFADTKDMCTFLSDYIKERLPNLVVRRFIGEDPDEHLYESDIVVSTPKSAGTAVDIDGLKISLLTSAISSRQANAQILGRLRHLKDWPDVTPRFFYLVCTDIPKHMDYHKKKVEAFKDKVLSHKLMPTSFSI